MEDNTKLLESLLDKTAEYSITSFDLYKLKTLDKVSDALSSFAPNSAVFILGSVFLLFTSLGLAFYLGQILDGIFYGFFLVAAFYGLLAVIIKFFLHNSLKKSIRNYIIKEALK
jgi:hypothetical protein